MKKLLKILNLVYLAIAGFAIAWYSVNFIKEDAVPFLRVGINANLTRENSKEVFSDEMLAEFNITRDDLFADGDIEVKATVEVTNKMLLESWTTNDAVTYIDESFISPSVDKLVAQIEEPFTKVAKRAAKSSIRSILEEKLEEHLDPGQDLYAQLVAGDPSLTKEQVSRDIDSIVNTITADGATLDSVTDTVYNTYNRYYDALGEGTGISRDEMKDEIKNALDSLNLVNEDGTIASMDEAIAALLADMLNGNNNSSNEGDDEDDEEPADIVLRRMLNPNFAEEEGSSSENSVAVELKKFISNQIEDKGTIAWGFKIAGIVWAVFVLGWAIKVFQVIICFFRKKPYVRTEIIGIIAGIVQVLLAAVSLVLILAAKNDFLTTLKRFPVVGGIIEAIPFVGSGAVIPELTFSALVPGILVLVNLVYSIIYGFFKRSFKRSQE